MRRFFRIGVVLGKPWAWVSGVKEDKQTSPKSINNALKNKVGEQLRIIETNFKIPKIVRKNNKKDE